MGTLNRKFRLVGVALIAALLLLVANIPAYAAGPYVLASKPASLAFAWQAGATAPAAQVIKLIDNSPNCEPITVSVDQTWLAVTPTTGCTALFVSVSVNTSGLAPGTYSGNVVVSGLTEGNSPLDVPVSLVASAASSLSITTTSLPQGQIGTAYSASLAATGGTPPYHWSATGLPAGLSISSAGVISGTPTQSGTSSTLVSVTFGAGNQSASANLPITILPASTSHYTLSSNPASVAFTWQVGTAAPASQSVKIVDNSSNCEPISVTADQTWLAVTPTSGCTALSVSVSVNTTGLAPGTYAGNVIATGSTESNSPFRVPVSLVVTAAASTPGAQAFLSWAASSSPIVGYNVYRGGASTGPFTRLDTSPVLTTSYIDTAVQAGNTYFYAVTAVNSSNAESAYSNIVSATIP